MGRKVHVHDFAPGNSSRQFSIGAEVMRRPGEPAKTGFYSCAYIHKRGHRRVKNRDYETRAACGYGSSPRRALAQALKHLGQNIVSKRRSSAFRGISRRGRR